MPRVSEAYPLLTDDLGEDADVVLVRREALYRLYMAGYLMVLADEALAARSRDLLTRGSLAMKVQADVLVEAIRAHERSRR